MLSRESRKKIISIATSQFKGLNFNMKVSYRFFIMLLIIAACNVESASVTPPDWYGDIPDTPHEFVFYGQGDTLSQAKISALSDLNLQLLASIKTDVSSTIKTLNGNAYRASTSRTNVTGHNIEISNIQWNKKDLKDGQYYVSGSLQRAKLIKELISTLEKSSEAFSLGQDDSSIHNFFYYKLHQFDMDRSNDKALLLNSLCDGYCSNSKIIRWTEAYSRVVSFPKSQCIKVSPNMDETLSTTLIQWFNQLGFVAKKTNCYLLTAQIEPQYFKKDNLKWAQGWLLIKLNSPSNLEQPIAGKIHIKGNSPRSYRSAFHNALNSFIENAHQKSGIFSSITTSGKT